jgi:hypothetical protein
VLLLPSKWVTAIFPFFQHSKASGLEMSCHIINEMVAWLEQQTDSEHLYLLHLASIKQYVPKICSHQLQ